MLLVNGCTVIGCVLLNTDKTVMMLLGPSQRLKNKVVSVSLNDEVLSRVAQTKYLGVIIDENLKWDCQINSLINKMWLSLHFISRLKPFPPKILLTFYKVYITPIYDYCCVAWQSCSDTPSNRIDSVHVKAIRILCRNSHLDIPTLPSIRRKYFIAVQIYIKSYTIFVHLILIHSLLWLLMLQRGT